MTHLLDANALIALAWPRHEHHDITQTWFKRHAREGWATSALTQSAFVRIVSQPAFAGQAIAISDVAELLHRFDACEKEALKLVELGLPLPAYEQVCKASHSFNLLDARRAISVTERQRYILRVRNLARAVAESYHAQREKLGFPGLRTQEAA